MSAFQYNEFEEETGIEPNPNELESYFSSKRTQTNEAIFLPDRT